MLQTYQTKIKNVQLNDQLTSDMYFEDYGKFFGVLERKLFVQSHIKGVAPASLKKTFSKNMASLRVNLIPYGCNWMEKYRH